jgi:hypothetical protein
LAPALAYLCLRAGDYSGEGVNYEGEPFRAELTLRAVAGGCAAEIAFSAWDGDAAFHEERSWVARDWTHDRLCLWTISNNAPGVLRLSLREDGASEGAERALAFAFGEAAQVESFREEIRLEFLRDGSLCYIYSWGLPGQELGPRSRARLNRQERAPCRGNCK